MSVISLVRPEPRWPDSKYCTHKCTIICVFISVTKIQLWSNGAHEQKQTTNYELYKKITNGMNKNNNNWQSQQKKIQNSYQLMRIWTQQHCIEACSACKCNSQRGNCAGISLFKIPKSSNAWGNKLLNLEWNLKDGTEFRKTMRYIVNIFRWVQSCFKYIFICARLCTLLKTSVMHFCWEKLRFLSEIFFSQNYFFPVDSTFCFKIFYYFILCHLCSTREWKWRGMFTLSL